MSDLSILLYITRISTAETNPNGKLFNSTEFPHKYNFYKNVFYGLINQSLKNIGSLAFNNFKSHISNFWPTQVVKLQCINFYSKVPVIISNKIVQFFQKSTRRWNKIIHYIIILYIILCRVLSMRFT